MGNKEEYFIVGKRVVFEAFKANYPIKQLIIQKKERYNDIVHDVISSAKKRKLKFCSGTNSGLKEDLDL